MKKLRILLILAAAAITVLCMGASVFADGSQELAITNTTGMFKAVTARLETTGENTNLVVALNGSGYENLYKGKYDDAIAAGIGEEARKAWINGYKNDAGKLEFVIPLESGEKHIPIVAISKSHLEKVEAGTETVEKCMFYRVLVVDYDAATLTTGDYYEDNEFAVTNNVKMFKPGTSATVRTTGTPSSNNYSNLMTLTMESDSFDKVKGDKYSNYGGTMTVDGTVEIELKDSKFAEVPIKDGEQVLKFHSKKNDAWYNRKLTVDLEKKTLVFDSLTEVEDAIEEAKDTAKAAAEEAKAIDTTVYSDQNANAIVEAIKALEDLVNDKSATVDKINAAKKTLEDAIAKADADKAAAEEAAKKAAEEEAAKKKAEEEAAKKAAEEEAAKKAAEEEAAKKAAEEEAAAKAAEEQAKKAADISTVKKTKVKGLKVKAAKKKMTVTWKANKKVFGGYQISYKLGKKTKTVLVKKAAAAKKVIKKLKSKKKYTVKIRGFKKIGGEMIYGKWSSAKKVKIK